MRKLATVAGAAGVGLVLALGASAPLMAHNVSPKRDSGFDAPTTDDGGPETDARRGRTLVEFEGGIGVQPVSAGNGTGLVAETVNRNIVRGVQPAGQPWRIEDFNAKVEADGRITARGKGLVFAGGATIGTALMITPTGGTAGFRVFATLICENTAPFVERSTAAVPLDEDGDFKIDDVLSPPPPDTCETPVLLIRNEANRAWFAAGIRKFADD
ncbi:hypothetical protein ONA70_30395 [Micromonospora yasonensis]|uniref:hypothetical protein n=1 Tax=Micromonospora yasonensis TaxID=1128667 RepID=UPI00222FBB1B|nr:hypothetical protein [Micromonospora yasonensis]MCW3844406.1 hypothetical protein [Micromonospora yasonensis]